MRVWTILVAVVVACVAAIASSARASAPSDGSFEATATVTEFAAGEYRREVAFASGCGAARVWTVGTPRPIVLDAGRPCAETGPIYGLLHAGRIVSWGRRAAGGFSFWLTLPSLDTGNFSGSANRIAMVRAGAQSDQALLVGEGRGNAVPYAVGNAVNLVGQHTDTGKPFKKRIIELPARPLWLSRSGTGRIAIQLADAGVLILNESFPEIRRTYHYRPASFAQPSSTAIAW